MSIQNILSSIETIKDWQEETYKYLHSHPELSMQETHTAQFIYDTLVSYGYETQKIGGGVGGVLKNGEGKKVLFRADIDALPVKEETGLPYASTVTMKDLDGNLVPVMHACGHDVQHCSWIRSRLGYGTTSNRMDRNLHCFVPTRRRDCSWS